MCILLRDYNSVTPPPFFWSFLTLFFLIVKDNEIDVQVCMKLLFDGILRQMHQI